MHGRHNLYLQLHVPDRINFYPRPHCATLTYILYY